MMIRFLKATVLIILGVVFVAGCGKMPDERLIEKARLFDEEQNFVQAAESYTKLSKLYPNSPFRTEALYRAGLVYTNAFGEFDRAISLLQVVIEEYPEDRFAAQCQFMIGFIHANSTEDMEKAREAYSLFIAKYPDHELVPSVEWELEHLGKDINQIPELQDIDGKTGSEVR